MDASKTVGTGRLPAEVGKPLEDSLTHLVDNSQVKPGVYSGTQEGVQKGKQADAVHSHGTKSKGWISKFWPNEETLDKLFTYEHMGNYVIDRKTGKKIFETMPIYVRVGMHLLFVSASSYMTYSSVEHLLTAQSVKQGKIYDATGEGVKEHVHSFIDTYNLPLDELLVTDLDQYQTFNAFFSRRLKASARPITLPADPRIVTSPADCRLTVFQTMDQARKFWVKGKQFTIPALLGEAESSPAVKSIAQDPQCSLAIARLAPQDYHRFHSPVEGTIVEIKDISGELYTVNPQAINDDLNVFTLNKRSVMVINANLGPAREAVPVAFVAIGAMLVGSIGWSKKPGDKVAKGEELGWFAYGGSTCITVFPSAAGVRYDEDILQNSEKSMETLVQVGMEIGKIAP